MKFSLIKLTVVSLLLAGVVTNKSMAKNRITSEKTGILLVSFGTSYPEAQGALDHIESQVGKAFPETEIHWAFTSKIIRKKLREKGHYVDSPAEALAKMGDEGFTKVAVQSLHVIPGEEYENLQKTVNAFKHIPKGVNSLALGKPLLYKHEDIAAVCRELEKTFPQGRGAKDAIVLMGHGTNHPSNIFYPGVQYYLWQQSPHYFLATVEGYPSLDDVLPKLKKQQMKTVWLIPFMSVAGDHARNDMAGEEPDSWKSVLEAEGYEVKIVMQGLAEYDELVNIWINHLKEALDELEN